MAFTGNEASEFPLDTAAAWTANYRAKNPRGIKAHFFGNKIIAQILAQTGCVGIRCYYALDENGVQQMIMVGADKDENDMYNGIIAEIATPCPPFCGGGSPLQG
jgi:hypothetical protein